jgi:hypothetical protein
MAREEQEVRVNVYNAVYCILQGLGDPPPRLLIPWGLEDTRTYLHTPTSSHVPAIVLLSSRPPAVILVRVEE